MRQGRDYIPRGRAQDGQEVPYIDGLVVVMGEVLNTRTGATLTRDDGKPVFWRWWAVAVTLSGRCRWCGRADALHWLGCPVNDGA
jgi:hypothetical protein